MYDVGYVERVKYWIDLLYEILYKYWYKRFSSYGVMKVG